MGLTKGPTIVRVGGAGWQTPHMKGVGMLVVSLRGINFGVWWHAKKYRNIHIVCVLTWSLLGVKKRLGPVPSDEHPHTFHMRSPPPPPPPPGVQMNKHYLGVVFVRGNK